MWLAIVAAMGADIQVYPSDDLGLALSFASSGDRILLEPGTHTQNTYVFLPYNLTIASSVPGLATLDMDYPFIVFDDLTLDGLQLTGFSVAEVYGSLTVTGTVFRGQSTAAYVWGGIASFTDVTTKGAPLVYGDTATVTATNLTIEDVVGPVFTDTYGTTTLASVSLVRTAWLADAYGSTLSVDGLVQSGFGSYGANISANSGSDITVMNVGSMTNYDPLIDANNSDVTLDGMTYTAYRYPALLVMDNADLTVRNLVVDGGEKVLEATNGRVTVEDYTANNAYGYPGAFVIDGTVAIISNASVTNGYYPFIVGFNSDIQVDGGDFTDNQDSVFHVDYGSLNVADSTFTGNVARNDGNGDSGGGAIWAEGTLIDVQNTVLQGNEGVFGGAMRLGASPGTLRNVWACGNEADEGGAVWADGALVIQSSGFRENEASGRGGALYTTDATVEHVTLLANESPAGAALFGASSIVDSLIVDNGIGYAVNGGATFSSNLWFANTQAHPDPLPATELQSNPYLIESPDCGPVMALPSGGSAAIDAGSDLDPDGTAGDLGSSGGTNAPADLWVDADGDGIVAGLDCDDEDALAEATALLYIDSDADAYGTGSPIAGGCPVAGVTSVLNGDCDDSDPALNPDVADLPDDGIDQDCTGTDRVTCFVDDDGDGFGTEAMTVDGGCGELALVGGDCDDAEVLAFPGAADAPCDGVNLDCGPQPLGGEDDDGDGLTWEEEQKLGTSDCDQDSDGDGVNDGDEVAAGSDPAEGVIVETQVGTPEVVYERVEVPGPSSPSYGCGCTSASSATGMWALVGLCGLVVRRRTL